MLLLASTIGITATIFFVPVPAQLGQAAPTTAREVAPEPKLRLPMNGDFFRGNVTELTQDTITLRLDTEEIRKFPIGSILRSGKYWEGEQPATYRLAEVKVGDLVRISCLELNGELRCETICIRRRPGGRVPPCPGEPPDRNHKWHEYSNAMQDFEEKGIPLPAKYDPRNMPGTINGIPVPARLLQPGVVPVPLPGVPPPPKTDPPPKVNGG